VDAQIQPEKKRMVETVSDVFEGGLTVRQEDDAEVQGVAFYAGCACTTRAAGGVLIERGPDRDAGLLWLHGPAGPVLGGDPWKQSATANALPARLEKATTKTLDAFARGGWRREGGYAKIKPMWFV